MPDNERMPVPDPAETADFSSLFQFLPIGAYRSSRRSVMLRANPALVRLNGYADEASMLADVNGSASDWYVAPGRRAQFTALLARDGFVRGFVSEVVRYCDGEHRWVSENAHGVYDPQGQLLYYEGTVEDITEQVLAQEAQRQSEEQLRMLTAQLPGMAFVIRVSDDGRVEYRFVSEGVREIYGLEPEAVLRDASLLARYRHPEDQARFARHIDRIQAGVSDQGFEFRIVRADGQIRWLFRRSATVAREPGAQVRVGLLLDITARKEAQLALLESEALWKLALDSAGDGVWDWNLRTDEEYMSPRICAMFGYAPNEMPKEAVELDSLTHPDDVPQMLADRQAHFDGHAPVYRNEHRVRCKDGRWKWVLSRGMVISRDEQGRALRMVGTHTDISDLKAAEAQQRHLQEQLRESQKMEAIGTLAGGVAHDFNNLLAAILGNLTLARDDVGTDHPAQESLSEIHRAAIRARQLVQQILAFSRRQNQAFQHVLLLPVLEEALGMLRALLPAGVRLEAHLGDLDLPVLADATQIQQVLMNLCTNAWQAMGARPGQIRVELRAERISAARAAVLGVEAGDCACLSVADDGPGMDADLQRRIFEPFFTTKAPGSGTGLGLSVVHGIVKSHRGAIAVRSAPGQGARFDVYLPLAHAETVGVDAVDEVAPDPAPAPAPAQRHIVYVDDYEALTFLAGRLLRKQGHRVTTFLSGEEALAWFQAHAEPVDLLVTDQNMPGVSGIALAHALRTLRPQLAVAIVTGYVSESLVAEAAAVGVAHVLAKQDSMDGLAEQVRLLLDTALRS